MNELPTAGTPETAPDRPFRRLHRGTLWVPLLENLSYLAILAVGGVIFMGIGTIVFIGSLDVVLPLALFHVLRYIGTRYRVQGSVLFIRSGVLWRSERRIPLGQIQDTKIRQGIFHQLFRVVKLEITTAASEEQEAALDVLSVAEADALRNVIFEYQGGGETEAASGETVLRLSVLDLLMGGLTSRLVTTLFALVGAIIYFTLFLTVARRLSGDWEEYVTGWQDSVLHEVDGRWGIVLEPFSWDDTLTGSVLLVLGGLVLSLARFVIRYYRYRITRTGNVLSRAFGLLTVRSSSLARDRIQALKVEEGLLRRWFGLAALWADSGGDRNQVDEEKNRDPFVPVASRAEAYRLVKQVLAGLPDAEPQWTRVSPVAIRRGTKLGWLILVVVMLPSFVPFGWLALLFLPGFPIIYYLNVQWYRNTGYWIDDNYLISRKGWLNRRTLYLPLRNLQTIAVKQSYFDRRLDLAKLQVDTAGQSNTGGGSVIRNVPVEVARAVQDRLAGRVATLAPSNILTRPRGEL